MPDLHLVATDRDSAVTCAQTDHPPRAGARGGSSSCAAEVDKLAMPPTTAARMSERLSRMLQLASDGLQKSAPRPNPRPMSCVPSPNRPPKRPRRRRRQRILQPPQISTVATPAREGQRRPPRPSARGIARRGQAAADKTTADAKAAAEDDGRRQTAADKLTAETKTAADKLTAEARPPRRRRRPTPRPPPTNSPPKPKLPPTSSPPKPKPPPRN